MDPCGIGINDLDAVPHVAVNDPVVHYVSYLCKLDPVVNSPCIVEITYNGTYGKAVINKDSDGICKVILFLRIISADPSQCGKKQRCLEHIHGRVDLFYLELVFCAVLVLNDLDNVAVLASNDPSVTCRIVSLCSDKDGCAVGRCRFKCIQSLLDGIC